MRVCPNCRTTYQDKVQFCPACGGKTEELSAQAAAPASRDLFCPNCGEKVELGVAFCGNCGAPCSAPGKAPRRPNVGGKKRMAVNPKIVGIAGGAVAIIVLVIILITSGVFLNRAQKFVKIQEDFLLNNAEKAVTQILDYQLSTDIGITASVNPADGDGEELQAYLDDLKAVLKVKIQDGAVINGTLLNAGTPILDAEAYYKDGDIGFYAPALSDQYYLMNVNRIFSDIQLDDASFNELSSDDAKNAMQALFNAAATAVTVDNVQVVKDAYANLDGIGQQVKCTQYIFKPSAGDIENAIRAIAAAVEENESLHKYAIDYLKLQSIDYGEAYSERELDQQLSDVLNEMADYARDSGEYLESRNFMWSVYIKGGRIYLQSITTDDFEISYNSYGKTTSARTDALTIYDGYSTTVFSNSYERSGKNITGAFTYYNYDYNEEYTINYDFNLIRKSALGLYYGTYDLQLPYYGTSVNLSVREGTEGTDHVLSIDNGYESFYEFYYRGINDLSVCVNTTDKKSSAKLSDHSKTDLSDSSDDRMYDVINELYYNFEMIIDELSY